MTSPLTSPLTRTMTSPLTFPLGTVTADGVGPGGGDIPAPIIYWTPSWVAKEIADLAAPAGSIWVRQTAVGLRDGSNFANATSFTTTSINTLIAQARTGSKQILVVDEGDGITPPVNIAITNGGVSRERPVVIRAVNSDGSPGVATITGDRAQPFSPGAAQGSPWLKIGAVAFLTFSGFLFNAWGNGVLQFNTAGASNIAMFDCQGQNLYRCLENVGTDATVSKITVRRFVGDDPGGFERGFSRFRYDSHDVFMDSVTVDGFGHIDDGFEAGFVASDTAHRFIYRLCLAKRFQVPDTTAADVYWNGDGFSTERGNDSFVFDRCYAADNTDGGFDCKGTNHYFFNCTAERNKNNWRMWGDAINLNPISRNPLKRGGTGAQSHFNVPQDTTPNVHIFGATVIDNVPTGVDSAVYHVQDSTLIASTGNSITTTGTLELVEGTGSITYLDPNQTAPTITSSPTGTVAESSTFSATPTANQTVLYWEIPGGADRDLVTFDNGWNWARAGAALTLAAQDFEDPADSDNDNVYEAELVAVNGTLDRSATQTKKITVTDVPGDAGGDAWHVRPTAHGAADGSDWANAFALAMLNDAIGLASLDGRPVWIRSDEQHVFGTAWVSPVSITSGGADADHPVVIEGRDLLGNPYVPDWAGGDTQLNNPMFVGNRFLWTLPPDPETTTSVNGLAAGPVLFDHGIGGAYLTYRYLGFARLNQPFANNGANHHLLYEDFDFFNCREGIFMDSTHGDVSAMTARRFKFVGFSKRPFRLRADTNDVLIEDFYFNSGRQDKDDFASGILCTETAHNITINGTIPGGKYSGIICNCHTNEDNGAHVAYWQGDGIQTERTNYDIWINRVTAHGNADGGFDLKSYNTYLTDCIAYDCKRNYRLWGKENVVLDNCTAYLPHRRGGSGGEANLYIGQYGRIAVKNSLSIHDGAIDLGNDAILWMDAASQAAMVNVDISADAIDGNSFKIGQLRTWDPTNTDDPVSISSSASPSVNEGAAFSQTITLANDNDDPVALEYVEVARVLAHISTPLPDGSDVLTLIGADAALFSTTDTALQMARKDFENPSDANLDGGYEVTIRAWSTGLKFVEQTITLTVADVVAEPWQFIGVSTSALCSSGNFTVAEPPGGVARAGDLLQVWVAYRDAPAFSAASGWTKRREKGGNADLTHANTSAANLVVFEMIRGASAPALVFPRTGGSVAAGVMIVRRNANASPADTESDNLLVTQSTTSTCPSVTTAQNNELLTSGIGCGNGTGSVPKWHDWVAATDPNSASPNPGVLDTTDPSGTWKLRAMAYNGTVPSVMLGVADAVKATAGATGTISAINAQTAKTAMITVADKRAVA